MARENWYPIEAASHDIPAGWDDWTYSGGANKNICCRPGGGRTGTITHDDGTTHCRMNPSAGTEEQAFNIDWPGPMASFDSTAGASAFTHNHRIVTFSGAWQHYAYFLNAAGSYTSAYGSVASVGGTWTDYGPWGIGAGGSYRPGGGSWTAADFSDDKKAFAAIQVSAGAGTYPGVTSVWGTIDFVPASGGFVFMFGLVGASALPLIGRLADHAQFNAMLAWRRRCHPRQTRLKAEEKQRAWRELREYRWPRYFDLRVA